MPSSERQVYESGSIEIRAINNTLIPLEVMDDQFNRLASGVGHIKHIVAPGIYLARCLFGDSVNEKIVRIKDGEKKLVDFYDREINGLPSAAPVSGSRSFHEYYSNDLHRWTQQRPAENFGLGSQLFILATRKGGAESREKMRRRVSLQGVKLRDWQGRLLKALPKTQPLPGDHSSHPLARFSVQLDPGGYLLEWPAPRLGRGKVSVQPIWLSQGWTTIIFAQAPETGGLPDHQTISIQMAREEEGFLPFAETATAAELALIALKTGRWYLPDTQLKRLLHEKFNNPMLGILGAHALLHKQEVKQELVDEVLQNLEHLCGDHHPDLVALRVMADAVFKRDQSVAERRRGIRHPPMVRNGLRMLLAAEWDSEKEFLSPLCRLASYRECAGMPWTMFETRIDLSLEVGPDSIEDISPSVPLGFSRLAAGKIDPDLIWAEIGVAAAEREQLFSVQQFLTAVERRGGEEALRRLKPVHLRWTGFSRRQATELVNRLHGFRAYNRPRYQRFGEEAPAT